uniref:Uncharacterized protein n=1 Tax=Rhizophora mucronata TaxID=61149 RepID=A0A2P2M9H4_RHIMU
MRTHGCRNGIKLDLFLFFPMVKGVRYCSFRLKLGGT